MFQWSRFMWGLCVPEKCSAQGLRASLQKYMDNESAREGMKVDVNPAACTTPATASTSWSQLDMIFW